MATRCRRCPTTSSETSLQVHPAARLIVPWCERRNCPFDIASPDDDPGPLATAGGVPNEFPAEHEAYIRRALDAHRVLLAKQYLQVLSRHPTPDLTTTPAQPRGACRGLGPL